MKNIFLRLFLSALLATSSHVALATSGDIQMLPPTNFNSATPCDMASNINEVLVFNPGSTSGSAINCNTKFTADSNGFVTAGGFWSAPSQYSGFAVYDRQQNAETNTFMGSSVFYRDSDVTALWDNVAGNVISFKPSGKVTFANDVNINGARLFLGVDGASMAWIGLQGSGTDAQRVGLGINGNPTTGAVNYLSANVPLLLGSGACSVAGQLQWDSTNNRVQYCDGTDWKNIGGSTRTWHTLRVPNSDTCMQNDSDNEMTITLSCQGFRWGMELYITAGSSSSNCGSYIAGEGGVAHVPGPGPSTFGMQGTIPPGWWWRWTAAAGTIPGVANCTAGSALY